LLPVEFTAFRYKMYNLVDERIVLNGH